MPRRTRAQDNREVEQQLQERLSASQDAAEAERVTPQPVPDMNPAPLLEGTPPNSGRAGVAQDSVERGRPAMATVALRGVAAARLRALAAARGLSMTKLLVWLMDNLPDQGFE
jgi:hypothetical protein